MKKIIRRTIQKIYYFAFPERMASGNARMFNCILGENSKISEQAIINNPSAIKANITIGKDSTIEGILNIWVNAGKIEIGDSSYIGEGSRVYSAQHIKIGNRVLIAHGCNIFDSNIHSLDSIERHKEYVQNISGEVVKLFNMKEKQVVIKDDAWIGASAIILKGVTIGKGAIVGAGSVVTKDIPDYTTVVGNPARVVKQLNCEM